MAKRRTLKANLQKAQARVKVLEQRVITLTKKLDKLSQIKVQEIENPIVELKKEILIDERAIGNMPLEHVKKMIAEKFLETTDEDGRWQPNLLDCIKFDVENVVPNYPNSHMRRVVAYLTAVNKNVERRTVVVV